MKLERNVLRGKVAWRIFFLFIACSLLPILVLSVISSRFVVTQLESQGHAGLQQTARSIAMEILARAALAESELRLVAMTLDGPRATGATSSTLGAQRPFDGLALLDSSGAMAPLSGNAPIPPDLDRSARERLAAGGVVLSNRMRPDGTPSILLSMALGGAKGDGSILVGEIRRGFLWSRSEGAELPVGTKLVVLDAEGQEIFDSFGAGGAEALGGLQRPAAELEWSHGHTEYLGHSWKLPLNERYGAVGWTLIVGMSREDLLAPLTRFTRLLPQVSLVCIGAVMLLSFVQIRRSMVPLESLRHGTERIARGHFDARVEVDSGDEFEDLADSFNRMALDLHRQFKTLATAAEIDRAILSTLKEQDIVRTVIDRIPDHFACSSVAVLVREGQSVHAARTHSRPDTSSDEQSVQRARLTTEGHRLLVEAGERPLLLERERLPPDLAGLAGSNVTSCLIVPIAARERLAGCIALGYESAPELTEGDFVQARRLANQVAVALANARLVEEMEHVNWETLHALARAVDANSNWTSGHSERVTAMALRLARRLGLPEAELEVIHRGGLLHDIGKIGVSGQIVDKPGPLTDEEYLKMRDHVRIGARILEPISAYAREIPIVLYHHERYDGKGYPEGLAGDRIPFHARILAVADVFDALSSERPYRQGWELPRVIDYIREGAGTLFDPLVVAVFFGMLHEDLPVETGESSHSWSSLQAV